MAKSFVTEVVNNKVLVVDGINLAFRWKYQGTKEFIGEYIATVASLAKSYGCGKVIIACDKGSSSYRKAIFPEYKANRAAKRELQTAEEAQDFIDFIEEYENTLVHIESTKDWKIIRFADVEADDIAAYIVKNRYDFKMNHVWLVSSDKDWDLLIEDDVSRFSYVTRKEITPDKWEDTHKEGYSREDYLSIKVLKGDPKDNVPGIPQIGPKRAMGLLEQYGTAFDIYAQCPVEGAYKYIQNLNKHADQILINYELLDLLTYCDDAIGQDNLAQLDDSIMEYMNGSV